MKKIYLDNKLVKFTIVDDDDYIKLRGFTWYSTKSKSAYPYAIRYEKGKVILLHRMILSASEGELVDHLNHDTFDNRKSNLRLCSRAENCANSKLYKSNTTGFKHVSWEEKYKKYHVNIKFHGKTLHFGRFKTINEAIEVAKKARLNLLGESNLC